MSYQLYLHHYCKNSRIGKAKYFVTGTDIIDFWLRTSIEAFLAEYTQIKQFLPNNIIWDESYQRTTF